MSWQANRYRLELVTKTLKVSKHHVPPRHPDKQPRFIRRVDDRHHRAYHLLFQAAASYEDACKILKRDWWTPPAKQGV